ncbi:hypothetical protein ES703_81784 [subsurface metagenome]
MLIAVSDNIFGQLWAKTRNIPQELLTGCIDLHTYRTDTAHNHIIQAPFEGLLVYIVLVLPHTNGFGIDLHQLCQGVHKAPPDGDRPPKGDVQIRKLRPSHLRGRIDGCTALIDNHYRNIS